MAGPHGTAGVVLDLPVPGLGVPAVPPPSGSLSVGGRGRVTRCCRRCDADATSIVVITAPGDVEDRGSFFCRRCLFFLDLDLFVDVLGRLIPGVTLSVAAI